MARASTPLVVVALACTVIAAQALTASKLSIFSGLGTDSWDVIKQGQPRLVKLLDVTNNAEAVKAAAPGTIVIGRIYQANQPQTGDATQAAFAWWSAVSSTITNSPGVDFWEGYNEPGVSTLADMQWYATFEQTRVNILAQHGLKASVGNFATGTPDVTNPSIMQAFNPAIDAAISYGGILGVHEYSSPYLWSCFSNATNDGWMTGRYRKWYNQFLLPTNRHIPLVISELGIDNSPCDSPNYGGWNAYCGLWASQEHTSDCGAEYLHQLAWYDSLLRQDSYVLGATIFQLDVPGWDSYDLASNNGYTDLIKYLQSQ